MNSVSGGTSRAGPQLGGVVAAGVVTSLGAVWLMTHMRVFGRAIAQPHVVNDYVQGWMPALVGLTCVLPLSE